MAPMPPLVRRFVLVLLAAFAIFAGWSAATQGAWMQWLLVVFLVGSISYLRKSNDSTAATILPPAAMVLSFGLNALQEEDLATATLCLVAFAALLGVVAKSLAAQVNAGEE